MAQTFLLSTLLTDFSFAYQHIHSPDFHIRYGSATLRPKSSLDGALKALKTALVESAKDGGSRSRFEKPIQVAQGILKQEIFFEKEGRSAKGRALILDPGQVRIEQRFLPEAVNFNIDPKIKEGEPGYWMQGLTLGEWLRRETQERREKREAPPLAASNSLQSNFKVKNGFLIVGGKLIAKPREVRGPDDRGPWDLDGKFSVFVLDEGEVGVRKVDIRNGQLLTEGIREAVSGPPLLIDGKDVSHQIKKGEPEERDTGPSAMGDEVYPWDPETNEASRAAIGAKQDGKIVLVSFIGNEMQDKGPWINEPLVTDFASVLQEMGIRDAILLGGSGDVQQYVVGDERPLVALPQKDSITKGRVPRELGAALFVYAKEGGFKEWTAEEASLYVRGWADLTQEEKDRVIYQLHTKFNIGVDGYLERISAIGAESTRPVSEGGYRFPQAVPLSEDLIKAGKEGMDRLAVLIVAGGAGSRFYGPAKEDTEIAKRFRDFHGVTEDEVDVLADRYGKMTIPLTKMAQKSSLQLILEALVSVDPEIPVVIGVGPDTKEHIESLLSENHNFGLKNVRFVEDDPNIAVDLDKKIMLTPQKGVFLATEGGAGTLRGLRKPVEGADSGFDWLEHLGRDQLLIFNADNPGLPLDILYGILWLSLKEDPRSGKKADIVGVAYKYAKDVELGEDGEPKRDAFGIPQPKFKRGTFVTEIDEEGKRKTVIVEVGERPEQLRGEIRAWEKDPNQFVFANAGVYFLSLEVAQAIVDQGSFKWHAPVRSLALKDPATGKTHSIEGHRFEHSNPDIFEIIHTLRSGSEKIRIFEVEEQDLLSMKNISEWAKAQDNVAERDEKLLRTSLVPDIMVHEGATVEVSPLFSGTIGRGVVIERNAKVYLGKGDVRIPNHAHLKGSLYFENGVVYHSPSPDFDVALQKKWKKALSDSEFLKARGEKPAIRYDPEVSTPEHPVQAMPMGPYHVQSLPGRLTAKLTRTTTPTAVVRTTQPFDSAAFNFNHVQPHEVLDYLFLRGKRYRVLTNLNPTFRNHVILHVTEEKAQYFEPGDKAHIAAMLGLQRLSGLRLFFNGISAGASKNHFHFQGHYHPLPVERVGTDEIHRVGDVSIQRLKEWPAQNIVLQSERMESLADALMQLVNLLMKENIPHNLLFLKDRIIVYLRSDEPSELSGLLEEVGLATTELSGEIIVHSQETFNTISLQRITEALRKTTLSQRRAELILIKFVSMLEKSGTAPDGGIRDKGMDRYARDSGRAPDGGRKVQPVAQEDILPIGHFGSPSPVLRSIAPMELIHSSI